MASLARFPSHYGRNWLQHERIWQALYVAANIEDCISLKLLTRRVLLRLQTMLRQLFFGETDMRLHARSAQAASTSTDTVLTTFREVANDYTVMTPLPEDRFLCSFGHIFAGGYAAGYYSYKVRHEMCCF